MAELLDQIRIFVQEMIHTFGYAGIALVMLIENLFPPVPSEVVLPFAGFLVARDQLTIIGVIIASTAGALLGAVVIYYVGKLTGEQRLRDWMRQYGKWVLLSEDDFDRVMHMFDKHGSIYILLGRVVPGVRSLISLPAGVNEMDLPKFLIYTTIGTVIWNALLATAGVMLGAQWDQVLRFVDAYETVIWVAIGVLLAYLFVRRLRLRYSEESER